MVAQLGQKFLKDKDELEDFKQDVFLIVYESLSSFRGESEFSTWVYRIARNHLTKISKKKEFLKIEDHSLFDKLPICRTSLKQETTEYLHEWKEEIKIKIQTLLSHLPNKYKTPIILYYFENLSYKEISEQLNLKMNTLKSYIHRGRELLKEFIHDIEKKSYSTKIFKREHKNENTT